MYMANTPSRDDPSAEFMVIDSVAVNADGSYTAGVTRGYGGSTARDWTIYSYWGYWDIVALNYYGYEVQATAEAAWYTANANAIFSADLADADSGAASVVSVLTNPHGNASVTAAPVAAGDLTATAAVAGVAEDVTFSLTATKAVLTVTAANKSVVYGKPLPKLTYTVTGFVNGDSPAALKGSPAETTTAKQGSAPGTYPISVAQGTLAAANYTFKFVDGDLIVTDAGTTATPTFSPAAGAYSKTQSVEIKDATAEAQIYYTIGSAAPSTSSTRYTGPIAVSPPETVRAIAVAEGYKQSAEATAAYELATAPGVATDSATGITASGAVLNGAVTAHYAATKYWFAYGTSKTSLTSTSPKTGAIEGATRTAVTATLTGLEPKTTYYFQAVASNDAGTTAGAVLSFATE
jgi:hypothetical protein